MVARNERVNPEVQTRGPARTFSQSFDTYSRPTTDGRKAAALQQALSGFSGIFEKRAAEARVERRNDERSQGIADAIREEAGEELKGVQTGILFRQNSKYYMAGLNETRGKAAATRFRERMALEYQEWDGRHTDDDGSGFREWMNKKTAEFLATLGDDPSKLAGAMPILNQASQNFAAGHTAFTSKRLETESWQAYDEVVAGIFNRHADGEIDMDQVVKELGDEADTMYATDGAQANDRMVDAALRWANVHNNPDAILALAKAHDEGRIKLSLENRERLADGADRVEADIERKAGRDNSKAAQEAKAIRAAKVQEWTKVLDKDPYAELPSATEVGDPATFREMSQMQDIYIKAAESTNPAMDNNQRMQLEAELAGAGTAKEKMEVLRRFQAENPNTLSGSEVSRYAKQFFEETSPGGALNNSVIKEYRTQFGDMLAGFEKGDGFLDVGTVTALKTQGLRHFNDYILSKSATINTEDPAAMRELIEEAEQYALGQLTRQFPDLMKEKAGQSPASTSLGLDGLGKEAAQGEATENPYRNIANNAQRDDVMYLADPNATTVGPGLNEVSVSNDPNLAGMDVKINPDPGAAAGSVDPAVKDTDGAPELAEGETYAPEELENEPEPFEDDTKDVEYSKAREGFYGDLIHRLTDGQDDRPPGWRMQNAASVLQDNPRFEEGVNRLAKKYNIPAAALLAVMHFETGGTFDPTIKNAAGSGATGIIQFMPKTARSLGTTVEALSRMTIDQQLLYVEKYLDQFGSRITGGNVDDVYMAVLYPKAIGKPDGYALFTSGTIAYKQNRGLDHNKDGKVTKYEAATKVRRLFFGY